MTDTTDTTPIDTQAGGDGPPSPGSLSVGFDPAEFLHFLDGTDWNDGQKADYITLVWDIVCEFVAMGYGVHPVQQAKKSCGQSSETRAPAPLADSSMLKSSHGQLIEKFVRQTGGDPGSGEKGVGDGSTG